ncbi:DUF4133 domain-containing protein [Emticicia sp. 21SJ11W-3]|uniref:DUF4133 domain-containing protein n=1 Tax=Emticicia sp. 21SJ11W-3 TaxID=2916755 RepID=UPI00209E8551|nr:DUF4133 domain-containing protein [Emticicia sp. 21SJ11W-3]UTA69036.1 DUF4133 domain-containing protein [Emticicia sp. 21SJ11W-3]
MANSIYQINKGINQSIEFKGLKAQYIWYLGGGLVILLIIFAILYFIGLPSLFCVGIVGAAGAALIIQIYGMSSKYGEHGLMKALARKQVPASIRCNSRKVFLKKLKK